jgi:hypothetical protein
MDELEIPGVAGIAGNFESLSNPIESSDDVRDVTISTVRMTDA